MPKIFRNLEDDGSSNRLKFKVHQTTKLATKSGILIDPHWDSNYEYQDSGHPDSFPGSDLPISGTQYFVGFT